MTDEQRAQEEIELQLALRNALLEHPSWERCVRNMVQYEEENPPSPRNFGWTWKQVQTPPSVINSMVGQGFLVSTYESRQYSHYRLYCVDAAREALEMLNIRLPSEEPLHVDDLFSLIIGHDKVKQLLRFAVMAVDPVHCLLVGPPGVAKSLMLSDIGSLDGGEFYAGSTTTKAGLVALLLDKQPRFLVIDEIDKMNANDTTPLLNLMETGTVTRLQHQKRNRITMATKVFAGANDMASLERRAPALLSRFAKFEIPPYSKTQFLQVASAVLQQREGIGPEMAKHIAHEVVRYSTDIRDAVRVARMSHGDPRLVFEVVSCMWGK